MIQHPLSYQDKQLLCDLIKTGLTYSEISSKMGISRSSVSGYAYRLKKYGLITKGDKLREEINIRKNKVAELRKEGLNYHEIAEKLGITYKQAQGAANSIGIKGRVGDYYKTNDHIASTLKNVKIAAKYKDKWDYIPKVGVSLLDLTDKQCHFPCKGGVYCGGDIWDGCDKVRKHYCKEHYKVMVAKK